MNKRAILYLRYSNIKQEGNTSEETQEKVCRSACLTEGYEVLEVAKNPAVSANKNNTQRIIELLDFCKARQGKFEVLMVFKLDRFARSQEQHHWLRGQLLKIDVILRSATEHIDESPSGRLVEGVLAAVNEYDNEVKRERVKLAMWARVDQGLWPWNPPSGYKPNRILGVKLSPHVDDDTCSREVEQIFLRYSTGAVTKTELGNEFNKKKIKNYRGKLIRFSKQTIHNMINNPYYFGYVKHWDGRIVEGKHIALIEPSLYEKCQEVQAALSNHATRKRQLIHPDFPLRRFVICAGCDRPLTACWAKSGRYPYYYCKTKGCSRFSMNMRKADFENEFIAYIKEVKPSENFIPVFNRVFIKKYEEKEQDVKGDYRRQLEEVKALEQEEEWVIEKGKKGILPDHLVKKDVEDIERKLTFAKMNLTDIHAEELDINALLNFGYQFIRTVEFAWSEAPIEYKLKLQRLIFPEGLKYDENGFTNSRLSPAFNLIGQFTPSESSVVAPTGVEPVFQR